jgi:type VI secretion system protein ImpF
MADLSNQERLQPCLIDRLTDDEPNVKAESRDRRVVSVQRYRQAVMRDLGWLLNTGCQAHNEDLEEFKEVKSSVINYGVRDVKGMTLEGLTVMDLEKEMTRVIKAFEPRLMPSSLQVRAILDDERYGHGALEFGIKGQLWANPIPEALYVRTSVDIDTGVMNPGRGG